MKRVTGVGGIFFKSENPEALYRWYETHLGIKGDPPNGASFPWRHAEDSEKKDDRLVSVSQTPQPIRLDGELHRG